MRILLYSELDIPFLLANTEYLENVRVVSACFAGTYGQCDRSGKRPTIST